MSDDAEWNCEGCGVHVVASIKRPPLHGFCPTCAWLSENLEPHEIEAALRRCEAAGHPKRPPGARVE